MILVDSTIYIDWLRNRTGFTLLLKPWVRAGTLVSCGVIRVEVLRGVLDRKQRQRLEDFFDLIPEIPAERELWRDASNLAWKLDREGKVLPLTDLVIGVSALSVGATVITLDKHFWQVPGLECRDHV